MIILKNTRVVFLFTDISMLRISLSLSLSLSTNNTLDNDELNTLSLFIHILWIIFYFFKRIDVLFYSGNFLFCKSKSEKGYIANSWIFHVLCTHRRNVRQYSCLLVLISRPHFSYIYMCIVTVDNTAVPSASWYNYIDILQTTTPICFLF